MALFTESDLRTRAAAKHASSVYSLRESADAFLRKAVSTPVTKFDVFLSHSMMDADLIAGAHAALTDQGVSVYVDWIVDKQLDRSRVTPETAEKLRERMRQCDSLIYAHSDNSPDSRWMPWELGFFDGFRSAVAIFPIVKTSADTFKGQEYLGLYPHVDGSSISMWVNRGSASPRFFRGAEGFKDLKKWLGEQRTDFVR